jgi:hypothetical protein
MTGWRASSTLIATPTGKGAWSQWEWVPLRHGLPAAGLAALLSLPKFTRSGLASPYLPGVVRLLSVAAGVGHPTGEDAEMPKLRVRRTHDQGDAKKTTPTRNGSFASSSPRLRRAFGPLWRARAGWSEPTPVGQGLTGSSGWPPEPGVGVRGRNTAAGRGGGAAFVGVAVAPPPPFPFPTATPEHRERLRALIATLPSPDREIILLRILARMSIPDIMATLGVTPQAILLAQHQALNALQPAATAPAPATRQRVVLLPHTRTGPLHRTVRAQHPREAHR